MERFLKQVTITGADESIDYHVIYELSYKYPFVEWGILLSKNSEGYNRFPKWKWIEGLITEAPPSINLSGHLCGSWVRDIINGGNMFLEKHRELSYGFKRFQLNFHGQLNIPLNPDKYIQSLVFLTGINNQQIIYQMDGVNKQAYNYACSQYGRQSGLNAVALHDMSGGCGVLPNIWPQPTGDYCGYAGGLSPNNLTEQLELIYSKILNTDGTIYPIWIDAETNLRSYNDTQFDLDKVVKFLEVASLYVIQDEKA
jgi:hypothetical protein